MKIKFDTVMSPNTNCIKDTLIIYIIHHSHSHFHDLCQLIEESKQCVDSAWINNKNDDYNLCASSGSSILLDEKKNDVEVDWPAKLA